MVRVFLDSSVLIAASASNRGASYDVILLGEIGLIKVVISSPILGAALQGNVNFLLTLNTRDFTPQVAEKVDLKIKTPGQFIQELRELIVNSIQ